MSIYRATQKIVSEVAANRVSPETVELAQALGVYQEYAMKAADASRRIRHLCQDFGDVTTLMRKDGRVKPV